MKNKDLFRLYQGLTDVSYFNGVKFAYSIVKNKKNIESEIKTMEEIIKPSDKFQAYEQKRVEVCEKHCERQENGQPVVENNAYKIIDQITFNSELLELKESNKDVLEFREQQLIEYNELLEEESKIELVKISVDNLPNGITPLQIESIYEIIEE